MDDPNADSYEAGSHPVGYEEEPFFPYGSGQSAELLAPGMTSQGDEADAPAAAASHTYVDPWCPECQEYHQQQQEEQQQEQQHLVPFDPVDEETFGQPYLPWDFQDLNQGFFPFPEPVMADDQYFQSLSDYEELNYFNQPYLMQQDQQQHLYPEAGPSTDEAQYQAAEVDQFQFGTGSEALEPLEFDFNTLPHVPINQPLFGEAWTATHDSGVFEQSQTPEHPIKSEADLGERSLATINYAPAPIKQQEELQPFAPREPPAYNLPPILPRLPAVVPPRRILPSNGQAHRPVHRQTQARARRLPIIQSPHANAERAAKDRFLVQSRLQGVSYKEIKRRGHFREAESTLRGRFRTLTKAKEDRVRDPKWTDIDNELLKEAVRVLGHGQHPDAAKLSWMAVSSYIVAHGGTYKFGYSTCHRRWVYLESTGQLGEDWYEDSWEDYDEDDEEEEETPLATIEQDESQHDEADDEAEHEYDSEAHDDMDEDEGEAYADGDGESEEDDADDDVTVKIEE